MWASVPPSTRIHWYVYTGEVSPSASEMPDVTAVSVSPTCAVPVIVGAPLAGFAGPLIAMRIDSPSVVSAHPLSNRWEVLAMDQPEVRPESSPLERVVSRVTLLLLITDTP